MATDTADMLISVFYPQRGASAGGWGTRSRQSTNQHEVYMQSTNQHEVYMQSTNQHEVYMQSTNQHEAVYQSA